jgi:solute carrier family 35 protein F5
MLVKDEEEVVEEEEETTSSSQETTGDDAYITRRHSSRLHVEAQGELERESSAPLTLFETMRLSFEFCILWTLANYFVSACLQYTTVASSTILTSTSSVFTLIFGVMFRVEAFTFRKTLGIFASLAGIVLISSIDLSGDNNEHRGDFPEKSSQEIAVGNTLALISAVIYGMYAVLMKKRITDESRINMPLFFGFVGAVNFLLFWPGLIILHVTGIETFELPPDSRVMIIILCNSLASLISDMTWAYAVLLTSPLVTTVGLSLTIPCSLIGQMIINNQTAGAWYWIGALLVLVSFIFVSQEDEQLQDAQSDAKRHDDPVRPRSTSHGHSGDDTAGL